MGNNYAGSLSGYTDLSFLLLSWNVSISLHRSSLGTSQESNIGLGKFPTAEEMRCSRWPSSRDKEIRVMVLVKYKEVS